MSTEIGF